MTRTYTPDRWAVITLVSSNETIKKVLAGWYGGFANGDSWKLSSGVERIEELDDHYLFYNYSGSIYKCYKAAYGMSFYMQSIYAGFVSDVDESNNPELAISLDKKYEPDRTN